MNKPRNENEFRSSREKELLALSAQDTTLGKSSYAKYLAENKKHINQEEKKHRMLVAREKIEEIRRWRKENGIEFTIESDFFL